MRFAIGDRVTGYAEAWGPRTGTIIAIDLTDPKQNYRIVDDLTMGTMWINNADLKPDYRLNKETNNVEDHSNRQL